MPFGLCKRSREGYVGCEVSVMSQVGMMSKSGLIGAVVKVVCVGCHPPSVAATWGVVIRCVFWGVS